MNTAKRDVASLLQKLPDDCTLEDIQYHLYVIEKIRRGIQAADTHGTLTQEEVERRLSAWTTK
jgi:predicted transcriptional regulator